VVLASGNVISPDGKMASASAEMVFPSRKMTVPVVKTAKTMVFYPISTGSGQKTTEKPSKVSRDSPKTCHHRLPVETGF